MINALEWRKFIQTRQYTKKFPLFFRSKKPHFLVVGESALLVFTEVQEVTKLRQEMKEENEQLKSLYIKVSSENQSIKSKLEELEKKDKEIKNKMKALEDTLLEMGKIVSELRKGN